MELSPRARRVVASVFLAIAIFRPIFSYAFYVIILRADPKLAPFLSNPFWVIGLDPSLWAWHALDLAAAIALFVDSPAVLYLGLPSFVSETGRLLVDFLYQSVTEPAPKVLLGVLVSVVLTGSIWTYAAWLWSRGLLAPWPRGRHIALGVPAALGCAACFIFWGYKGARFVRLPSGNRSVTSAVARPIVSQAAPVSDAANGGCGASSKRYSQERMANGAIQIWEMDKPICPPGTVRTTPLAEFSPKLAGKFGAESCFCWKADDKPGP